MEYIRKEIGDGIGLNIINTDKFKSSLLSFSFIRPLSDEEASLNALIPLVLRQGTENYRTSIDIERKLEELYGANLSIDVNKKGEKHIIKFSIEGANVDFTGEADYAVKLLEMLLEIIYNPLLENGAFLEKYIYQEKENMIKRIESRINDKKQYAVERCIEEMCRGEKFSIYKFGSAEDVKKITKDNLYSHYQKMLKTSFIEITAVGKEFHFEDKLYKSLELQRNDIVHIQRENISSKKLSGKSVIYEKMDVNQGKLILGYRINIPYENPLFNAFIVGNEILGGGPNSKLFTYVRERESLAYYVYSQILKYKSIMLVSSGIETDKFEKTKEIIKMQVEEIIKGNFSEEDINNAKNSIVTSIKTLQDSNYSLAEFYLTNVISKENKSFDEYIYNICKVNREEIIKSFKDLKLDTIYFLTNETIETRSEERYFEH
ncbi:Predicted Zn-dependent peptidase [Proteiniborus ethanoligenes]|uniref:Predicted Zn-dependent peptidase n=1 Tax=Proteiniborus ethanoligenes TaxID=415015 RepID=A0A1H3JW24_9FIRM|nr:insulinase family protein [Proteiniborus ethanoligenes]SDY43819.1 Predicted Zn-dependent peptidase [Proteiniborus ethanoligenes]